VLQATITIGHGIQHKDVTTKRNGPLAPVFLACTAIVFEIFTMPEANLGLANGLGVSQQFGAVKARWCPGDHKAVGNAAGGETAAPEGPNSKGQSTKVS
jgi:hypothetical protein